MLDGKTIIIGVTASVAIYKTCELIRRLRELQAEVFVMMSKAATNLISPQLLAVLSGHEVLTTLFGPKEGMKHIELAKKAVVVVICPATANVIGKLAHGLADSIITTVVLATKAPILICPAMNPTMWANQLVQDNVARLRKFGMTIVPPTSGEMACGDDGVGRLAEMELALELIERAVTPKDLLGKKVLITAGPTIERIDPVRYVSNFSSGKMGLALAMIAARRGAKVTLIVGGIRNEERGEMEYEAASMKHEVRDRNLALGIKRIEVENAKEMYQAVMAHMKAQNVFISAAAVTDFRPKHYFKTKLNRSSFGARWTIDFIQNPDILQAVSRYRGTKKKPILVGFALETEDHLQRGRQKFLQKKLDFIVINGLENFRQDEKKVILLDKTGVTDLPRLPTERVAEEILTRIF